MSYLEEIKYGDGNERITYPIFPMSIVAAYNWLYGSAEGGLGGYPGFNWTIAGRLRPGYWDGHAIYLGSSALFSVMPFLSPPRNLLYYQSIEAGYELIAEAGFTLLAGGGIYIHGLEGKFKDFQLVTPMAHLGLGYSFIDPSDD